MFVLSFLCTELKCAECCYGEVRTNVGYLSPPVLDNLAFIQVNVFLIGEAGEVVSVHRKG